MSPTTKNKRRLFSFLLPLLIITVILGYFQLFYKSKQYKTGIAEDSMVLYHDAQVRTVQFSPNDSLIATGSVDKTVRIWDARNGKLLQTLSHPEGVTYLDFTPDGSSVVTSSYDGALRLWDLASGKITGEVNVNTGAMWTVAVSPGGKLVAAGGEGKEVIVWQPGTGKVIGRFKGHERNIWSVRFTPDGQNIISGSFDNNIRIWNVADGRSLRTIDAHTEAVVDVSVTPDGKLIASTSDDKSIRIWRLPDVQMQRRINVPEHIQAADFCKDGRWLLVGGRDKPMIGEFLQEIFGDSKFNTGISARLIDVATGEVAQTFDHHFNDVNDVAFSNSGEFFATASEDHSVRVYRMRSASTSLNSSFSPKVSSFCKDAKELSEPLTFVHMLLL